MYDIIVFENLCFRPSIRKRVEAVVFKNLHSGDRFWKAASFIPVNAVYTWTKGKKRKKSPVSKIFGFMWTGFKKCQCDLLEYT